MAIVDRETYNSWTTGRQYSETDGFANVEKRVEMFIGAICTDMTHEAVPEAIMLQIEYLDSVGGVGEWMRGSGNVSSEQYTTGGESESRTYRKGGNAHTYVGLALCPMAELILRQNGLMNKWEAVYAHY